jgi:phosphoribosyl-ATP pyrophosphohydrolase
MKTQHDPLGDAAKLGETLARLAQTIDARAGADPDTSWTAKLLMGGPALCAKKLGEEGVEAALAVASESDDKVASEAADVLYHLLVALRSRGVPLNTVADVLAARDGQSGLAEKAGR